MFAAFPYLAVVGERTFLVTPARDDGNCFVSGTPFWHGVETGAQQLVLLMI